MLAKLFWLTIGSLLLLLRFDCNGYYYKARNPYEIPQRTYYQFWPKLTNSISNKDYKVYEDQMDDYEMISHFQNVPNFGKHKPLQFMNIPSYYDKYLQQNQNRPSYHFTKMTNLWTTKRPIYNYYKQHTIPINFKYTSIPEADSYNLPMKHQQLTNFNDNSYNVEVIKEISPPSVSWNNQLDNNHHANPVEISNYDPNYDFNQNYDDNKAIVYDNDSYNYEHINKKTTITTNNQPDKPQYYHYFSNNQNLVNINNNVDSKITEMIKIQQQPVINQDLNANFEDKDNKTANVDYNQPLKTETLPDYHKKPIETPNLKTYNNQFKTTMFNYSDAHIKPKEITKTKSTINLKTNNKQFKTTNNNSMFNYSDDQIKLKKITKTKPTVNQNILDADIKDDDIETYVYSKFEPMRLTKKKKVNIQRRASIKRQIPSGYIIYITERVSDL